MKLASGNPKGDEVKTFKEGVHRDPLHTLGHQKSGVFLCFNKPTETRVGPSNKKATWTLSTITPSLSWKFEGPRSHKASKQHAAHHQKPRKISCTPPHAKKNTKKTRKTGETGETRKTRNMRNTRNTRKTRKMRNKKNETNEKNEKKKKRKTRKTSHPPAPPKKNEIHGRAAVQIGDQAEPELLSSPQIQCPSVKRNQRPQNATLLRKRKETCP